MWEGQKLAFIDNLEKEIGNFDIGILFEKTTNNPHFTVVGQNDELVSFSGKVMLNSSCNDTVKTQNKASFFDISNSGAYIHKL